MPIINARLVPQERFNDEPLTPLSSFADMKQLSPNAVCSGSASAPPPSGCGGIHLAGQRHIERAHATDIMVVSVTSTVL